MLAAEHRRHNPRPFERRAKPARRSLAFIKPKASAPKLHHPDVAKSNSKTPDQRRSRVLELPISNGASPVASALGIRSGATPRGPHQPNITSPGWPSKQDISTLPGIGHFYFALTGRNLQDQSKGSDSARQIQDNPTNPCRLKAGHSLTGQLTIIKQSLLRKWATRSRMPSRPIPHTFASRGSGFLSCGLEGAPTFTLSVADLLSRPTPVDTMSR